MVGSFIEAHLFGRMKKNDECVYHHILVDASNAQGDDKENFIVGEGNLNMRKDVVIKSKMMQL